MSVAYLHKMLTLGYMSWSCEFSAPGSNCGVFSTNIHGMLFILGADSCVALDICGEGEMSPTELDNKAIQKLVNSPFPADKFPKHAKITM